MKQDPHLLHTIPDHCPKLLVDKGLKKNYQQKDLVQGHHFHEIQLIFVILDGRVQYDLLLYLYDGNISYITMILNYSKCSACNSNYVFRDLLGNRLNWHQYRIQHQNARWLQW